MDLLQFSLFFVALVVGYVLVHLRLVRFEEHLQKLAGIRNLDDRLVQIDDRLRVLVETIDRMRFDRLEGQLERLHEDLEDLREATTDVQHAVVQIPPPATTAPLAAERASATPQARIVALVEARLLAMGYHDIDVLTDLAGVDLQRDLEVQVECWRGGMPIKGRVMLRNGSVRDVALQSVAQMFP